MARTSNKQKRQADKMDKMRLRKKEINEFKFPDKINFNGAKKSDLTIILDVDNTLLRLGKGTETEMHIEKRPFALRFIKLCYKLGTVIFCTAAGLEPTQQKLDYLGVGPERHIMAAEHLLNFYVDKKTYSYVCFNEEDREYKHGFYPIVMKNVENFKPESTIIFDDTPLFYSDEHLPNVVPIVPFQESGRFNYLTGGKYDSALAYAGDWLKKLAQDKARNIPEAIKELSETYPWYFTGAPHREMQPLRPRPPI